MAKEPEYLKRLRESRRKGGGSAGKADRSLSVQEQEAIRWARETAGTDLRAMKNLGGAKYVALVRVQSATGARYHSIEGLPSREALIRRLMPDAGMGEEVLAAYEVRGGRPIAIAIESGEVKLRMGDPRPGANPVDPEKMLRQAAADAAKRAKTRPRGEGHGRGR